MNSKFFHPFPILQPPSVSPFYTNASTLSVFCVAQLVLISISPVLPSAFNSSYMFPNFRPISPPSLNLLLSLFTTIQPLTCFPQSAALFFISLILPMTFTPFHIFTTHLFFFPILPQFSAFNLSLLFVHLASFFY